MEWLIFALLAPLMYAISNVVDKYALEQHTLGIADYMSFASIGSLGLFIFLYASGAASGQVFDVVWPAILSGILMNGSYLLFALALTRSDSYRLMPFFLLIPVLLVLIDAVFYDAPFTSYHWAAVALAICGSVVLAIVNSPDATLKFSAGSAGFIMLVSVLLLTAGVFLMDKLADPQDTNGFVMLQCFGFFVATLFYPLYKPWRYEIVEGFKSATFPKVTTFAINDAADLFGSWLFVAAVALAPSAGFVSLALGIQPFYVIAIIYVVSKFHPSLLSERIGFKKGAQTLAGAMLITIGLLILALSPQDQNLALLSR
ncbi:EamA family transporter [Pseudomonas peli]|uniref:EamA family transporter n=1 Tax=Pseudomonas peli TaxID=592361 RepID=UPI0024AE6DB9|nr:EamA family transporter [Pseudomonas peli]